MLKTHAQGEQSYFRDQVQGHLIWLTCLRLMFTTRYLYSTSTDHTKWMVWCSLSTYLDTSEKTSPIFICYSSTENSLQNFARSHFHLMLVCKCRVGNAKAGTPKTRTPKRDTHSKRNHGTVHCPPKESTL